MSTTASCNLPRYDVLLPARLADPRPSTLVYVRRRLLVALVAVAVVAVVVLGAGNVLANRGGDPASTSAVRPATTYVAHAGDTMWSIASRFHGAAGQADYVDALIEVNGGVALQVGQVVRLP
jgi:LysM repeat protein